ncbi:hypothetical protein [Enterobacter cloacae]|uniref:hypothetical protein n=1 Tax=Enterobacter cloacae TaxID=550 RepID=UPI0013C326E1|nr:hypothetical protein [Enterobacter cloacae]
MTGERARASLKTLNRSETTLLLLLKNYWGFLSPQGEGKGKKKSATLGGFFISSPE